MTQPWMPLGTMTLLKLPPNASSSGTHDLRDGEDVAVGAVEVERGRVDLRRRRHRGDREGSGRYRDGGRTGSDGNNDRSNKLAHFVPPGNGLCMVGVMGGLYGSALR